MRWREDLGREGFERVARGREGSALRPVMGTGRGKLKGACEGIVRVPAS